MISPTGIGMDKDKHTAITEWLIFKRLRDVQSFLSGANFDPRSIHRYAKFVASLTRLTGKDIPFVRGTVHQQAFAQLKVAFTTAPILARYDFAHLSIVETDASDFVYAAVLSQMNDTGILHQVACFSKKISPARCNCLIDDKELLAVGLSLEEWRKYLEAARFTISVLTDHKNSE